MSQVNKTTNDSEEKSLLRQPRATASWSRSGSRERLSRASGDIPEEQLETPAMPRNITQLLLEGLPGQQLEGLPRQPEAIRMFPNRKVKGRRRQSQQEAPQDQEGVIPTMLGDLVEGAPAEDPGELGPCQCTSGCLLQLTSISEMSISGQQLHSPKRREAIAVFCIVH